MFPVPRSHLSTGLQILKGCCRHQHPLQCPIQEIPGNRMALRLPGQDWRGKDCLENLAECVLWRVLMSPLPFSTVKLRARPLSLFKNNKLLQMEPSMAIPYFSTGKKKKVLASSQERRMQTPNSLHVVWCVCVLHV
jgi:hypothetical protein